MIILEIPEKGIRKDAYEVSSALAEIGELLMDDEPNMKQLDDYFASIIKTIKESADMKDVPKEERLKAIGLSFTAAGAIIVDRAIVFSDEQEAPETE
jgi:hypothetical protein